MRPTVTFLFVPTVPTSTPFLTQKCSPATVTACVLLFCPNQTVNQGGQEEGFPTAVSPQDLGHCLVHDKCLTDIYNAHEYICRLGHPQH